VRDKTRVALHLGLDAGMLVGAIVVQHRCKGISPGTLARGGVETSGTLGGDVVRNTVRSPVLAKLPERQTKKSFRSAYSHGSWFRNALFSRAGPVACDPALELGSFHPRRAPSPVVEDSHTGPRRRSISRETSHPRQLEGFDSMRFQIVTLPDIVDGGLADSLASGHEPAIHWVMPLGLLRSVASTIDRIFSGP